MNWTIDSEHYSTLVKKKAIYSEAGKITKSIGILLEAYLPGAAVGSLCHIFPQDLGKNMGVLNPSLNQNDAIEAEVVGFRDKRALLMPFEEAPGINNGSLVVLRKRAPTVEVGDYLLGRVLDGRGAVIDGKELIKKRETIKERYLYEKPTHPLQRNMVEQPLDLGIRAINGLLTCGKGQRLGIMAGSGVGKSVLLGMMARHTAADVNVIALVGERGREVREFIEKDLGPEGLKKSVVVVATSDKSPLLRMRAAFLATSIAEHFRDQGKDVLLLMDSVTRFCMAQREIGLSMGEPPASKGYPPSVFSLLPKLLERAGMAPQKGSITGLYSVLVEGDEMDDPVADSARSILDGHIVLSRKIAQRNQFPAIDILQSTSRVMRNVIDPEHLAWANQLKDWLGIYGQVEDLINVGAYVRGSNPRIDQAVAVQDRIIEFLKQGPGEVSHMNDTLAAMHSIVRYGEAMSASLQQAGNQQRPQGNPALGKVRV